MVGNPSIIALRQSYPLLGRNLSGPLPSESLKIYSYQEGVEISGVDCESGKIASWCNRCEDVKTLFRDLFLPRRIHSPLKILESGVRAQGIYQRVFEVEIGIVPFVSLL